MQSCFSNAKFMCIKWNESLFQGECSRFEIHYGRQVRVSFQFVFNTLPTEKKNSWIQYILAQMRYWNDYQEYKSALKEMDDFEYCLYEKLFARH